MRRERIAFFFLKAMLTVLLVVFVGVWYFFFDGAETMSHLLRTANGRETTEIADTTTATDFTIDSKQLPWNLRLINGKNPLDVPIEPELTYLKNDEAVDSRIYPELQRMFDDARAAGVYPVVAAGYRSHEKQQTIMDDKIAAYMDEGMTETEAQKAAGVWVAQPGTSEHELGLSVDINADGINSAGYEVYEWLNLHAHEYGFIQRYTQEKSEITGISNEDWHYRYVGREAATQIYESGECLEEYLMRIYGDEE